MASKKPYHVSVKLGGKIKTSDQLIKKFMRLFKESGVLKELNDKKFYLSKKQKHRKKKHAAKMRWKNRNTNKIK